VLRLPITNFTNWTVRVLCIACLALSALDTSLPALAQFESPVETPVARHRLNPVSQLPEDFSTLTMEPGFLLSMNVYDEPELAADVSIDANGDVTIPTIGRIHIEDKTLTEAAHLIEAGFRDQKILIRPSVNLTIIQYASQNITVLGEVHEPGRIGLLAPHDLADILALAGGETQYAGSTIEVQRRRGSLVERRTLQYLRNRTNQPLAETLIFPGDVITIVRAGIVYVLGAVNRPGGYLMQQDGMLDVTQALALANGTQMMAAVGSMRILRKIGDEKIQEIPISFGAITRGHAASPKLQADDVIYVPISKAKVVLGAGIFQNIATAAIYAH
jgi:polysaccharide export outer membrane protein